MLIWNHLRITIIFVCVLKKGLAAFALWIGSWFSSVRMAKSCGQYFSSREWITTVETRKSHVHKQTNLQLLRFCSFQFDKTRGCYAQYMYMSILSWARPLIFGAVLFQAQKQTVIDELMAKQSELQQSICNCISLMIDWIASELQQSICKYYEFDDWMQLLYCSWIMWLFCFLQFFFVGVFSTLSLSLF